MSPLTSIILACLLLLGVRENIQAASSAPVTNGPAATTKILVDTTVFGISEGVIYGCTIDNAGESIGFASVSSTNVFLYSILNQNSAKPSLFTTNGDFQTGTNFPSLPRIHSRFTEITGYSEGIVVGNFVSASGTHAFLVGTNGALSFYSYAGAKPATTVITGISQGTLVGNFTDHKNIVHGFSYNATNQNFSLIDNPDGLGRTHVNGIAEGIIFGSFVTAKNITNGFIYGNATYSTITEPHTTNFTEVTGFSQGTLVGNYISTNRLLCGFLYDGTNLDSVNYTFGYTHISGIYAGGIVGGCLDSNSVLESFYYYASNNVRLPVLITTNFWVTTLGAYPLQITSKLATRYIAPPNKKGGNGGSTGVTLSNGGTESSVPPTSTNTLSTTNAYNYLGAVGALTDSGSGTQTLSGSNSYSGVTIVATNSLTLDGGGSLGGTITSAGGAVNFGVINGNSSGTVTLGGSNTYNGGNAITVGKGTLTLSSNVVFLPLDTITIYSGATLQASAYANFPSPPVNGLVFTPDTNNGTLTISNASSSDYTLGNLGCSNFITISPGDNDTVSYTDYTGTNPDISLALWEKATSNPFLGFPNTTNGAFLILPGTNKIEFLLP